MRFRHNGIAKQSFRSGVLQKVKLRSNIKYIFGEDYYEGPQDFNY